MTILGRIVWSVFSMVTGVVLGAYIAYYGPLYVAVARNDNPFKVGSYAGWMIGLSYTLPILFGITLGVLAWLGRWRRGLIVSYVLVLAVVAWHWLYIW